MNEDLMSNIESNINSNLVNNYNELEKKLIKYRKKFENYRQDNENLMSQLTMLKQEIKNMNNKYDEIRNLIKSFISVTKAKDKKQYDEVLNKLNSKMGLGDSAFQEVLSKETKDNKKGLLGLFK